MPERGLPFLLKADKLLYDTVRIFSLVLEDYDW